MSSFIHKKEKGIFASLSFVAAFTTTTLGWWLWIEAPYWFVIPICFWLVWSICYGVYLVMKDVV